MSQDTHLFSAFKRPRETLSAINNNMSAIPQPTSSLKRVASNQGLQGPRPAQPNFRHSMLPPRTGGSLARTSSGGNLVDMGITSANPRDSRIGGGGGANGFANMPSSRKSYAPTSSAPQSTDHRRSSVYSRPSMGAGPSSSFFGSAGSSAIAVAGTGKVADPRPLRDPAFRGKMAQDVQDFLIQYNFEMETKHTLGPKALLSPMQKDFVMIFQWLYHRIDPSYKFSMRGLETEAIPLLKAVKYPYLGNITKAQLGAVGGANNWPTYLGLLHWMVQLIQAVENFDDGQYDDAIEQQNLDIGTAKVGYRYLSQCYMRWLNDEDDFTPFKEDMIQEFEERSAQDQEILVGLQADYDELVKAISELEDESGKSPLDKLKSEGETLRNDQEKFRKYTEHQREKTAHFQTINTALREEGEAARAEIARLEVEKTELQTTVDRQGLSTGDIDRMNTEREKLTKGLETVEAKLEEALAVAANKEAEALKKLELLEHAVKRYNELGYKIGATSTGIDGQTYEIDIIPLSKAAQSAPDGSSGDDERLLYDVGVGYGPRQVLNLDLRHDVKPTLNKFRGEIATRIHTAQDVSIKNQDKLDNIQETLKDKAEELETLEARLSAVNDEYSEIKETSATETSASNAEIEKLERELQSMRINAQSGLLALEQRLQSVNIEYDQLTHGAHVLREWYHAEVEKMLQGIIHLKMHVQDSLAAWDEEVDKELEGYRETLEKKIGKLRI